MSVQTVDLEGPESGHGTPPVPSLASIFDKHGVPIERGDIVKVFHFVGARGKRHYMYKQCLGTTTLGPRQAAYFKFSHLNFIEDSLDRNGPFFQCADGRKLGDYEIVQSITANHEDRPKAMAGSSAKALDPSQASGMNKGNNHD